MFRTNGYSRFFIRLTFGLVLLLDVFSKCYANQRVVLVAGERLPYIAESLQNNGYVFEVASEAFKRVGYDLDVEYYPIARATKLAQEGRVTGLLPMYYSKGLTNKFWFSTPFPRLFQVIKLDF